MCAYEKEDSARRCGDFFNVSFRAFDTDVRFITRTQRNALGDSVRKGKGAHRGRMQLIYDNKTGLVKYKSRRYVCDELSEQIVAVFLSLHLRLLLHIPRVRFLSARRK